MATNPHCVHRAQHMKSISYYESNNGLNQGVLVPFIFHFVVCTADNNIVCLVWAKPIKYIY